MTVVPAVLVLAGWAALVAAFGSSPTRTVRGPVLAVPLLCLLVGSVWLAVNAL